MEQRKQVARIYRLTNAPNEILRMEAQAAIVQLYGFEGLRFLDILVRPLSEWQQIHLLRLLSRTPGTPSGKLREWLRSSNPTVRDFARKLTAEHHPRAMMLPDELRRLHIIRWTDDRALGLQHRSLLASYLAIGVLAILENATLLAADLLHGLFAGGRFAASARHDHPRPGI